MKSRTILIYLLITICSVAILVLGKSLMIPFILALFIWFLIAEIRRFMTRIPWVGNKVPKWVLTLLTSLILFIALNLTTNILVGNIQALSKQLPEYEANLMAFVESLKVEFGFDIEAYLGNMVGEFNLSGILGDLFSSITEVFSSAFMVVLYLLFILLEESMFAPKIQAIFSSKSQLNEVNTILSNVNRAISSYITLKTLISLLTGVCSFIALYFIGVDAPIFWAFLIFLLNFIPTIGSLIASIFPALMALMQFGDATHFILVITIIGAIQLIIGNIVEPKIMGNSLNVSPLVVVIALSFWGAIWGITGMVLSVPITVVMIIILSQFKSTKPIAILLSEKGKV